jgi:nucleoid-associated protein YgaU
VRVPAVVVLCLAVEHALVHVLASHLVRAGAALGDPRTVGLDALAEVITAAAAAFLVAAWTWLSCGAILTAADVLRHGAATKRRLAVPPAWHRLVVGLLGAGALCLPATARADSPGEGSGRSDPDRCTAVVDGLPLPDRPTGAGQQGPVKSATYRVVAGDSLWSLSRDHVGAGATDARVAATWPRWYAANRTVIGPDPDLLLPGTTLTVPGAPRTRDLQHLTENRSAGNDGGHP